MFMVKVSWKKNLINRLVALIFATSWFIINLIKMKKKILFVLCLMTGLLFINGGLDKFFHYMPVPEQLPEKLISTGKAFAEIGWLMPLVGVAEIIGGLLLIFGRTRALGVMVLLPVVTGILLTNVMASPSTLPMVFVIIAVLLWSIADNWHKYLSLIREPK